MLERQRSLHIQSKVFGTILWITMTITCANAWRLMMPESVTGSYIRCDWLQWYPLVIDLQVVSRTFCTSLRPLPRESFSPELINFLGAIFFLEEIMQTIKLAFIWFKIYSLEIHVAGCDECLECVSDPKTINRIIDSRIISKREIHRLRGLQRELQMRDAWRIAA